MIEERIVGRLKALVAEAALLSQHRNEHGHTRVEARPACSAWLAAAQNAVHVLIASPIAPYRLSIDKLVVRDNAHDVHLAIGRGGAVLAALLSDLELGLLATFANQVRAEVFDDFLDHARQYLKAQRKNESGTIAGVVFEDSLRRLCDKLNITQKGVNLDLLISELTSAGAISATKAKRARVAAHVRTKATHAQWDEFDLKDVEATIEFTSELLQKLDA